MRHGLSGYENIKLTVQPVICAKRELIALPRGWRHGSDVALCLGWRYVLSQKRIIRKARILTVAAKLRISRAGETDLRLEA